MGDVVALTKAPSGRAWRLNEDEDEAMRYLPHADQVLYMRGIRPFVDFSTGLVGVARRVSYQQFSELLEVHRPPGSTVPEYRPTKQQLRGMIERLERAGLVVKLPQLQKLSPMVFRLPLADVIQLRSNEEQHKSNIAGKTQQNPVVMGGAGDSATFEQHSESNIPPDLLYNSTKVECENSDECSATQSVSQVEQNPLGNCPHSQILSLWQKHFPGKSQPNGSLWAKSEGAKHLRARWRDAALVKHRDTGERLYLDQSGGLEWWDRFLGYLATSDFLHESNWFEFRWLIKPTNFAKALEGKYQND